MGEAEEGEAEVGTEVEEEEEEEVEVEEDMVITEDTVVIMEDTVVIMVAVEVMEAMDLWIIHIMVILGTILSFYSEIILADFVNLVVVT